MENKTAEEVLALKSICIVMPHYEKVTQVQTTEKPFVFGKISMEYEDLYTQYLTDKNK